MSMRDVIRGYQTGIANAEGTDLRANVAAFHVATGIKDPDRPCVPADGIIKRQQIGDCAFCGRKSTPTKQIVCLGVPALVCVDPVRQTDKPMPPNCAWRYCARATNGAHNTDQDGSCKDCGKPAIAPK